MNIAEILRRAHVAYAGRPAIQLGTRRHSTYQQLYHRVTVIARHLRDDLGMIPGQRVALVMENRPEYLEVVFAAWHAGLVVVPMNAKLHVSDFLYILHDSTATVCFTSRKLYPQFEQKAADWPASLATLIDVDSERYDAMTRGLPLPLEPRDADDLAWLFYTSGTTGRPKGAMQSHRNLYSMLNDFLPMSRRDMSRLEGCEHAWQQVLERAGRVLGDLSFVETHDCFTIAELMQYEAMGLTACGEGARALQEGWTQADGLLPVNVSGGLKAKGHPIGATGVSMHVMAVQQLSGRSPGIQLSNCSPGGVFNMGGTGVANYASILAAV